MQKRLPLIFLLLIASFFSGQSYHIAIAENGLNIRSAPELNAEKIGKLYYGAKVTIVEKTGISLIVKENGEDLEGEWVKITFFNFPVEMASAESGYVFSGFLKPVEQLLEELQQEMAEIPVFQGFSIDSSKTPFVIKGDFFGDKVSDYAFLLKKEGEPVKLGILDQGGDKHQIPQIFFRENEKLTNDFDFVGVFRKAKSGEVLWANWVEKLEDTPSEGYRRLEDVPKNEKIVLNYDAFYVHAAESCGGGYIYWHKGQFIWLQQE